MVVALPGTSPRPVRSAGGRRDVAGDSCCVPPRGRGRVPDASPAYLVAVVVCGVAAGTWTAVAREREARAAFGVSRVLATRVISD